MKKLLMTVLGLTVSAHLAWAVDPTGLTDPGKLMQDAGKDMVKKEVKKTTEKMTGKSDKKGKQAEKAKPEAKEETKTGSEPAEDKAKGAVPAPTEPESPMNMPEGMEIPEGE